MSYIPLHHKYRPQTFAQLVGQEAITATLSNALRQDRIAPAYLFTGARGTGKTSSARIFAKSLNCIAGDRPTPAPCGTCSTCLEITRGNALDVIEIDAASNTGVDNIRDLIEKAQFAPVRCRYKVYVIDEVHMLSNAAFNSLLKTLEEPPDRVVFILATTDPQRVLPTIISRCQRFDFRRIPLDALTQHLTHIAQQEAIAITPEATQLIGQISQGGLRDAESLLDQLSLLSDTITPEKVWDLIGAVPEQDLLALTQAIAQNDPETMLDRSRRLLDRGREPLIVLQNLAGFYRDLLIAKTAPGRHDLVAVTLPTWQQMMQFVQAMEASWLLTGQQHLRSAEVQIKQTTQPRLWLEITLMGLLPNHQAIGSSMNHALEMTSRSNVSLSSPSALPTPSVTSTPSALPTPSVTSTPSMSRSVSPASTPASTPAASNIVQTQVNASVPDRATPAAVPSGSESSGAAAGAGSSEDSTLDLAALWDQILANIDQAPALGIIKPNCRLLSVRGSAIEIGVTKRSMLDMVKQRQPLLGKACAKTLKGNVKIILRVVETPQEDVPPLATMPSPTPIAPPAKIPVKTAAPAPVPPPAPTPMAAVSPSRSPEPDDEVTRAAKSLADTFNGQIVDLEAPEKSLSSLESSENIAIENNLDSDSDLNEGLEDGLDDPEPESDVNVPF